MKRVASLVLAAVVPFCVGAKEKGRPKIYGIAQVRILTTDAGKANIFDYGLLRALVQEDLHGKACDWCEPTPGKSAGPIEFDAIQDELPRDLLAMVLLLTDNAEKLGDLLKKNNVEVGKLSQSAAGASFSVSDPKITNRYFLKMRTTWCLRWVCRGVYFQDRSVAAPRPCGVCGEGSGVNE